MNKPYSPVEPDGSPDNNSERVKTLMAPYRQQIDDLDDAIMDLFAKRFAVIEQVAYFKGEHNIPVTIPERVNQVTERIVAKAQAKGLPPELFRKIYGGVIEASCQLEHKKMGE